jgi:outer membrane biosynthesis protein TonB
VPQEEVSLPPVSAPPPTPPSEQTEPPPVSPVAPEVAPSPDPPDHRAQLPVVAPTDKPAPAPEPLSWKEALLAQLKRTQPRSVRMPTGTLAPTFNQLQSVAANDPRMHDEETERRLMVDHGAFFRRGVESLRRAWHPLEAVRRANRDPTRRCGWRTRTTFAVAVLDKTGRVVDVDLKDASGCADLDDEAVAAFKRVTRFPSPPLDLFKAPDGTPLETARFPVRFIVAFDGSVRLQWQ